MQGKIGKMYFMQHVLCSPNYVCMQNANAYISNSINMRIPSTFDEGLESGILTKQQR